MYLASQIHPPVRSGWWPLVNVISLVFARSAKRPLSESHLREISLLAMANLVAVAAVAEMARIAPLST